MTTIFLNYRTSDSGWAPKLIKNSLTARFGADIVFLDSDSIPLAAEFPPVLAERARTCDVMLALIGPRWLSDTGSDGRPLLFAEGDWVHREIAIALAAGRPVAAVLLNGAPRLTAADLPPDIRGLADRQDITLRKESYDSDITRLEERLMDITPGLRVQGARLRRGSISMNRVIQIGDSEDLLVDEGDIPVTERDVRNDTKVRIDKARRTAIRGPREKDPATAETGPGAKKG